MCCRRRSPHIRYAHRELGSAWRRRDRRVPTDRHVPFAQIELLDTVALNLHRIDKDVQRCDRNYCYFTTANLEKLRNIMCRCEGHILHLLCRIHQNHPWSTR